MNQQNIYLKMQKLRDLTFSERQVIEYILREPLKIQGLSTVELGAMTYTSAATVSRLCHKIGFDSYSDFKLCLTADLGEYQEFVCINTERIPVEYHDSLNDVMDKVIGNSAKALFDIKKLNSEESIQKCLDLFFKAERINLFGSGISNLICRDAMLKGLRIGLNITSLIYYSEMSMCARLSGAKDLGIIVSYTGHTSEMIKLAKILKTNKVSTISITRNAPNEIVDNTDLHLYVPNTESFYRVGGTESRMSMQCVLDILFTAYINHNDRAKENIEKTFIEDTFSQGWKQ
ncbi:MurR/RpiR family transcriptional regulator [Clostridiales bacterium COT073_COT-073]|nr:MurR/RpiR family transcriptional regulator [Clostridiales bacterium COT073_COT-073]